MDCRIIYQWKKGDLNNVSKRLVMALDAIGFSEKTRETVTDYAVLYDIMYNIDDALTHCIHCWVTMGSQREGTTNYMLQSDHDALHYCPLLRVFETIKYKTNCRFNTHLITINDSHTPTGYTKIQLVHNGEIVGSESEIVGNKKYGIHHFEKFKYDTKGRFVLSNEFIRYNNAVIHSRNGPADTVSHRNRTEIDHVRAYMFDDIPVTILPWFSRTRKHGWPSDKTLKLFQCMGCFVVPIGQAYSEERNLEWRFSMSFQERYLMLNLNESQYKCYILLKLIKKFIIKPKFGDVISSYHCKTCLFYTIEKYGTASWTNQNLLKNLIKCLKQMLYWIDDYRCPNFFIPDENMLNKNNQRGIKTFIESFIQKNCFDLLHIKFQNFGNILSNNSDLKNVITSTCVANEIYCATNTHSALYIVCKYGASYNHAYFLDCLGQHKHAKCFDIVKSYMGGNTVLAEKFMNDLKSENWPKLAKITLGKAINYMSYCLEEIGNNSNHHGKKIIPIALAMRYIFLNSFSTTKQPLQLLNELNSSKIHYDLYHEKQLVLKSIQLAILKVLTDMANLLVVDYIRCQSPIDKQYILLESISYFDNGKAVNYVKNRLKFARLFIIRHMYRQCHTLLNQLVIIEKQTIHTCICYCGHKFSGNQTTVYKDFRLRKKRTLSLIQREQSDESRANTRAQLIANNLTNCVIYDYYELEVIAAPLFYEAFRSFGTTLESREDINDYWFDRVVIDPVICMHFMLIECSDKLDDRAGYAASLGMLENILFITCDNSIRHLETPINQIGHVYVKKGWTKLACECFRKSFKVRHQHNAAKWHVMFMLFGQ